MAAITSIDINNGVMMRAQDMTILKANEDSKPFVEQAALHQAAKQQEEEGHTKVKEADNVDQEEYRFDAREGSSNQYSGNRQRKKKKKQEDDGKIVVKGKTSGFDISI